VSNREYYNDAASAYAEIRRAIGVELLVGYIVSHVPKTLGEIELVDAGCGVGLYSAALAPLVQSVVALDQSPGMLAQASATMAQLSPEVGSKVALVEADIRTMPVEDASADVVLASLVLHHVARTAGTRQAVVDALRECRRVVRRDGLLITITCSPSQVLDGAWYCALLPRHCLDQSLQRHGQVRQQEAEAIAAGFELVHRSVPVDEILHGEAYFDARGPLDPQWRRSDSIFSLASDDEIAEMEAALSAKVADGTLEQWFTEREAKRRSVGQVTISAYKKSES
jgi:ubiquinone/menaquinone biosynthesis C-methylase UbiE